MNQWTQFLERLDEWAPPLRPCAEDVFLYEQCLRPSDRTLLLGVTPELMHLADVAVDNNAKVIEGAVGHPRAVPLLGDWGDLPFHSAFDAIIGDGCLNVFQGTPDHFFAQMRRALKPGGRLILRVFLSPEEKEPLDGILYAGGQNFHAYKWRVAHALANPYVRVQQLFEVVHPVHPHPTLDVYRGSPLVYYFPQLSELPAWAQIAFSRSYELAERCPVVMWDR